MKRIVVFLLLFLCKSVFGQKEWVFQYSLPIDSSSIWEIDGSNNTYIVSENLIKKFDSKGKLWAQQSIKAIGSIEKIDARNPLKIGVFSEDQQRICYLDNALAIQNECLELGDYEIQLATTFSSSIQSDRVWIYDQLNSEIQLITLRNNQKQIIQNIKGLVDLGEIINLIEYNNELFVIDNTNQIARFDNFGNFIDVIKLKQGGIIRPADDYYLRSDESQIYLDSYNGTENEVFFQKQEIISNPITQFQFMGTRIYISTKTDIYCFELK